MGSKGSNAQQGTTYNSIRTNTSCYGKAVPVVYGTTRISINLIDYMDFRMIVTGGGGGK